jgi:hypothetical protein
MHSFSHAHCLAAGGGRRSCLALYGSASGSGLRSPYASSPTHQAVSCSTLLYLWTGSSSPVASHPAFRRRSFLRLRTASVLSDGDFHPTVGAHSQAHVGTRSRAIRRGTSRSSFSASPMAPRACSTADMAFVRVYGRATRERYRRQARSNNIIAERGLPLFACRHSRLQARPPQR